MDGSHDPATPSDGSAGLLPPRRRLRRWLKIGAILIALLVLGSFFDYLARVRQAILPWAGWYGYTQSMTWTSNCAAAPA